MDIHEKQLQEADPTSLMVKSGSVSPDSDSKKPRRLCIKVKVPIPRKDQPTLSVQQLYQSVSESQPQPEVSKFRRCEECGKEFSSGKAFGGHVRVHMKGNKKIRSSGATPATTTRPVTHLSSSPRGKEDERIKCYVCNKDFQSMKSLFGHMSRHPERDWRGVRPPNLNHQAPAPPPTPTPTPPLESNSSNTTCLDRSSFSSEKEEEEEEEDEDSGSKSETESETESETSNDIPIWTTPTWSTKGKRGRTITEEMIPAALSLVEMKHGKPINMEKANEVIDEIKGSKKKKIKNIGDCFDPNKNDVDHQLGFKKIPKSKTLTLNKGKEKMDIDFYEGSKKNSPDYSRRSKGIVIVSPEEQQCDESDLSDIMVQPLNQWVPVRSSSNREQLNPFHKNGPEGRKKLDFDLNKLPEQLDDEDGTQA